MNEFLVKKLSELQEKYWNLVSYARKSAEDRQRVPGLDTSCRKIERDYPEEIENLQNEEEGNWHHGFNSGMLACLNLILDANEPELCRGFEIGECEKCQYKDTKDCLAVPLASQEAWSLVFENFPFLDT